LLAQTTKNNFGRKIPTGYGNNDDAVLGQCLLEHPVQQPHSWNTLSISAVISNNYVY